MADIVTDCDEKNFLEIGVIKAALESFRDVIQADQDFGLDTPQGVFIAGSLRGLELFEGMLDGILAAPSDEEAGRVDLTPVIAAYENHTPTEKGGD